MAMLTMENSVVDRNILLYTIYLITSKINKKEMILYLLKSPRDGQIDIA